MDRNKKGGFYENCTHWSYWPCRFIYFRRSIVQRFRRDGNRASSEKLPSDVPFIQKDLFELTTTDLASFDVVVDAFNAPKGKEEMHQTSLSHLIEMLEGTDTRLIVVGVPLRYS